MRGFGAHWPAVLGGAIDAARAVLLDLDATEIPAGIRRVAGYQGGRLPPPLALRLLKELDENEWFRAKVAEAADVAEDAPSSLFLNRPAGWWLELAGAEEAARGTRDQRQVTDLETRIADLEAKLATMAKQAKVHKKELAEVRRAAKQEVDSAKKAIEQRYAGENSRADELRDELRDVRQQMAEAEAEHQSLLAAFDALRVRLAKARRSRLGESGTGVSSRSLPSEPLKLARALDGQAIEFGRDQTAAPPSRPRPDKPLLLAPGVRPDSSDAIRWLLGLDEAVVVIVDGYNAQFHIDRRDFTSGQARRYLVDALQRLRSTASSQHRVVVVYDSTLPGERDARTSLGGVEVRFAEEDRIADEEIVDMTAQLGRVVVISSDRAVREGAEDNGAVVLWSEALGSWLSRT